MLNHDAILHCVHIYDPIYHYYITCDVFTVCHSHKIPQKRCLQTQPLFHHNGSEQKQRIKQTQCCYIDLMMCDCVIKTGVHCDLHGILCKVFRLHNCQSPNTQRISFLINTHDIGNI